MLEMLEIYDEIIKRASKSFLGPLHHSCGEQQQYLCEIYFFEVLVRDHNLFSTYVLKVLPPSYLQD
jgi:hypothetical protein